MNACIIYNTVLYNSQHRGQIRIGYFPPRDFLAFGGRLGACEHMHVRRCTTPAGESGVPRARVSRAHHRQARTLK